MIDDGRCAGLRDSTHADLGWLYGRALRLTHRRESAEDLTQDVLLRACEHLDPHRSRPEKRAWLVTVMRNLHADRWRRGRLIVIDPDASTTSGSLIDSGALDPALRSTDCLAAEHVRLAIAQLPATFGDAVMLVDIDGLSYEEAAAQLDVEPGTVSSRVSRGRARLRGALWKLAAATGISTESLCAAAAALLDAYESGATSNAQAGFVEEHLTGCPKCAARLRR